MLGQLLLGTDTLKYLVFLFLIKYKDLRLIRHHRLLKRIRLSSLHYALPVLITLLARWNRRLLRHLALHLLIPFFFLLLIQLLPLHRRFACLSTLPQVVTRLLLASSCSCSSLSPIDNRALIRSR